jgi:predicted Fe-Mo cluster-binding NifX family protein
MNDIGTVAVETDRAIFFDAYAQSRRTGSFILIDPDTNNTVAAGMIIEALREAVASHPQSAGLVVRVASTDPALRLLQDYAAGSKSDLVVVSNWNKRAVDLLTAAGIHVVVSDDDAAQSGLDQFHNAGIDDLLRRLRVI